MNYFINSNLINIYTNLMFLILRSTYILLDKEIMRHGVYNQCTFKKRLDSLSHFRLYIPPCEEKFRIKIMKNIYILMLNKLDNSFYHNIKVNG